MNKFGCFEFMAAVAPHPDWEEGTYSWRSRPHNMEVYETPDETGHSYWTLSHEGNDIEGQEDPMSFVQHSPDDLKKMFGL